MARSAPGSSTRTPPATDTNTSLEPRAKPPWRASTASTRASRLRSTPLATRRGGTSSDRRHERLHLDQQRPRSLHRAQHHRARTAGGLLDEARGGVLDLDQPPFAHLEDPDLVGRAEAVLERPQGAVGALALALELEHAVHQVLEHARARERALLGHVPDEDHRHLALLGHAHQPPGHLAHLAHRAGRAGHAARVERLHGVDHADVGPLGLERGDHGLEVGLRHDRHAERRRAEPLGPEAAPGPATPRPTRTAPTVPAAARLPSAPPVIVDLPMPGAPPISTSEPGTMPPPSTRSSSPMPVSNRASAGASTSRERHRLRGLGRAAAARAAPATGSTRTGSGGPLLDHRVPLAAAGAAPVPFRRSRCRSGCRRRRSSGACPPR